MKLLRAWIFSLMPAMACLSVSAAEPETTATASAVAVDRPVEMSELLVEAVSPFPVDPAFDRYCDPAEFVSAIRRVDAEGAVDFAMQLAHGESILGRERRGLSVDHALAAALVVATEVKSAPSIERVRRAAERFGKKELLAKIAAGQKLSSVSRDDAPPRTVNVLETDVEQFCDLKDIEKQLRIVKLSAHPEFGAALKEHIAGAPSLTTEQKQDLGSRCIRLLASAADKAAKPADPLLARLATPVRGCGMDGTWSTSYQAADGSTVEASVQIDGNSGTYDVPGCQGQLYDIRTAAPFGGGPMVVKGRWRFCGGETGTFSWSVDGDSFRGYWTFSGGGSPARQWNGQRSDGGGGGGGGGTDPDSGSGGGGDIDPLGGTDSGGTDPTDGAGLESFLGGDPLEADNGSTISLNSNGSAIMSNSSGMRVAGRVRMNGDGTATANFNIGGQNRHATIRVLNSNQIQVGRTIFSRR